MLHVCGDLALMSPLLTCYFFNILEHKNAEMK